VNRRKSGCIGLIAVIAIVASSLLLPRAAAQEASSANEDRRQSFSRLPLWDDGLSEMSYYDATDTIYGVERKYTRVHLLNRQWMSAESGVKTEPSAADAVAVFKLVIAEEIPTENYDYRFQTTLFLKRNDLSPFKMVASSQEWCGVSYKHLRWTDDSLSLESFGYFPGEGRQSWMLSGDAVPVESLVVLARAAVADGRDRPIQLLGSMRSTKGATPTTASARLVAAKETAQVSVPAGSFEVRRVRLSSAAEDGAYFDVEAEAPYRLIVFQIDGVSGRLRGVERRAYWDRATKSHFYRHGEAP